MYLKTDRIVVTIKDVVFRSFRSGTVGQYVLDPNALTGWDDTTNTRRDATVRPVSSGDFSEPYTFSARVIGLSGTAVARDRSELQRMRDNLAGVLNEGEYAQVSVETSTGTRYATVGLENKIEWVQQLDNVALFRVELYAPDPYIYGYEQVITIGTGSGTSAGGGLTYPLKYALDYNAQNKEQTASTVTNNGNVDAWPKFVVTGDYYSGFTITDGKDKSVTYNGMVTPQSPVTIDMAKGTAMQNRIDKSTNLSEREWFSVGPSQTMKPKFIPIADVTGGPIWLTGWCDIIIRDTFI